MTINLSRSGSAKAEQIIALLDTETWETVKDYFPKSVSDFFEAEKGQFFIVNQETEVYFLVGLGDRSEDFEIQQAGNKLSQLYKSNFRSVTTEINAPAFNSNQIGAFVTGLYLGTYEYPFGTRHQFWKEGFALQCQQLTEDEISAILQTTTAICEGQFVTMEWLNKPNNFKRVDEISGFIKTLSEKYHFKRTVFNRSEAEEIGLGAFLAVNQGSSMDCAFTVLEYNGGGDRTIGFVGKCVLFDTGGISLKNSQNLHYMKSDLGGAMGILGTLIAVAELKLPVNLIVVLPITDNAIGSKAYTPSDVVTAYNGKTIEILNTDAEGRLTLSDGLAYLTKNYKTEVLIDMATLTGSVVRMFGETCGALFCNDQHLKESLLKAGEETHQRLWNLPLWNDWEEEIQSDVADFKNISMKPVGDCFIAAKLLEQFTGGHPRWAHIDMAAMAFGTVSYTKNKAATGYGVQLLLRFIKNFIQNN